MEEEETVEDQKEEAEEVEYGLRETLSQEMRFSEYDFA